MHEEGPLLRCEENARVESPQIGYDEAWHLGGALAAPHCNLFQVLHAGSPQPRVQLDERTAEGLPHGVPSMAECTMREETGEVPQRRDTPTALEAGHLEIPRELPAIHVAARWVLTHAGQRALFGPIPSFAGTEFLLIHSPGGYSRTLPYCKYFHIN